MSSPSIPLRLLAASAALLVLAGCASSEPTSDAAASAQATAAESQTSGNAGLESAQTAVPEANGSEYGAERLHLALGEQGGWTYANTDDLAFGVAITNMTWYPVCDGDMYMAVESPANGRYVELTMEITTATDYVSALGHEMAVFWNDWVSETADGRLVDNSSSSLTCLPWRQASRLDHLLLASSRQHASLLTSRRVPPLSPGTRRVTGVLVGICPLPKPEVALHEAIVEILREYPEGLTSRELANAVNEAGKYRRKDGAPVPPSQIAARTHNYADTFERIGDRIRLAPR